jgi:hypothetical protein
MGIIGRPFEDFINKQVKSRQTALGEGLTSSNPIDLKTREAFMTAAPFIRLASSVSITNKDDITKESSGKSVYEQIKDNGLFDGLGDDQWVGSGLSQNCILNGVPTSYKRDSNGDFTSTTIAGALNVSGAPFGSTPDQLSAAYGWGYNANGLNAGRGYVPPPGITSVDFEYKNDGALAQATVNIKAFSPEQFAIIDILYMRPGFTVLLEFGHSVYLNNEGEIEYLNTSSTSPFEYLFDNASGNSSTKPTYSEMARKIRKEKKAKDGNYEGFFGRITKFSWKFNTDGSYNITVKLTGTGDVINSLNVNLSKSSTSAISILTGKGARKYVAGSGVPKSTQKENLKQSGGLLEAPSGWDYDIDEAEEEGDFIISDAFESQLNFELYQIFNDNKAFQGNALNKADSNFDAKGSKIIVHDIPILGRKYTKTIYYGVVKYDVSDAGGTEYSPITLVKFGALLSMIQKICNVSDGKSNSLIQFEMVRNIFAKEISKDPNQNNYDPNTGNVFQEDETYMATYPGNFSSDPNICLKAMGPADSNVIGGLTVYFPEFTKLNNVLKKGSALKVDGNKQLANPDLAYRLSQVWVNLNFVTTLLKDLREKDEDEKQTVPLLDLVQGILTGINEACGGINNFRVIFNEDTSEIQILSEAPCLSVKKKKGEVLTEINTYGFDQTPSGISQGSFVTSLDLNSELSDKMATQITIGTAANGGNLDGDGAIFSSYSKGLKDTMFVDKVQTLDEETGAKSPTFIDKLSKIFKDGEFAEAFIAIYNNRDFSEDGYISTLKQINSSVSPKIMERYFNTASAPAPSFLPFNMSITMHGLGGIRIYDAFKIDGKVLPLGYNPDNIKLIIKSLSHSISLDGWKTTISTLSMPDNEITLTPRSKTSPSSGASSAASTTGSSRTSSNKSYQNFSGPTPNADKLRGIMTSYGIKEKPYGQPAPGKPSQQGPQISNGGDITADTATGAGAILAEIYKQCGSGAVKITGGNDLYHQNLSYSSNHTRGRSIDLTVIKTSSKQKIIDILDGFSVGTQNKGNGRVWWINEYANQTSASSGGHFHINIKKTIARGKLAYSQFQKAKNRSGLKTYTY